MVFAFRFRRGAMQFAFPVLNLGLEWTTFGRLRPLHTSAAVFAFGGSVLFATSFYAVQRTCRVSLFGGPALANFIFWGYQWSTVCSASRGRYVGSAHATPLGTARATGRHCPEMETPARALRA